MSAVVAFNQKRAGLAFPTDGVVIRLNDCALYKQLGSTSHHPRGALARKWKATPKETRLLRIEWTRATSGQLTPVAIFEPVDIDGATLQPPSLFTENYLRAMDLKIGDVILVIRAGGSVPEIIGRCSDRRTGAETDIPGPPQP
jgi:DNA ligase (NAD+)